jgi:hypothetical protein
MANEKKGRHAAEAPLAGAVLRTCGLCSRVRLKRPVEPMEFIRDDLG